MKITIFIVVFASMQTFALDNYAQTKRMDVKVDESSIVAALEKIEAQSEFFFFYNNKIVKLDKKVSVDLKDKTITEILDVVFKDTDIEYTINNRQIILSGKETGSSLSQQGKKVTGKVSDSSGATLPGVSVVIKGSTTGVITDNNGNFSLSSVPENAILQFSFVGMKNQEVVIEKKTAINVILEEETVGIEEVIAVGYNSKKRSQISSSIATVSSEKLKAVTSNNIVNMLQGQVAGVVVSSSSGNPNANANIIIRGSSSISAGSYPLYVVDGIIGGNADPNDIESITILKDAAATGLYGSRASNGVIIITTKSGKSGKTKINFSSNVGFNTADKGNYRAMNSHELYEFQKSFYSPEKFAIDRPASLIDTDTDWWNLFYRTGLTQSYDLSVSGGSEKTQMYVSGNYYNEEGTLRHTNRKTYNLRANIVHNINQKLKIGVNFNSRFNDTENDASGGYGANIGATGNIPWDNPFNPDGSIKIGSEPGWIGREYRSYLYDWQYNFDYTKGNSTDIGVSLDYSMLPNLVFTTTNRISYYNRKRELYYDVQSKSGNGIGILQNWINSSRNLITSNRLKYDKSFGLHVMSAIAVLEGERNIFDQNVLFGNNIPTGLHVMDAAAYVGRAESTMSGGDGPGNIQENAFSKGLVQIDYSFNNRYFFVGSFINESSSRFGSNNRSANFYTLGSSWVVNNENFIKKITFINQLKLRASYGKIGNANIGNYQSLGLYSYAEQYANNPASYPFQLGNPNLTWEKTGTVNLGVDVGVFNRITLNVDWYDKTSKSLLLDVRKAYTSGYSSIIDNIGSVRNSGVEINLNTKNFDGKLFKWETSFNIAFNKNRVLSLFDGKDITSGNFRISEGHDLYSYYMRKFIGVNPENGDPLWEKDVTDANGNVTITSSNVYSSATMKFVGTASPKYTGGIYNTLTYKGFYLNAFANFVYGILIPGYGYANGDAQTTNVRVLVKGESIWKNVGDIATYPKAIFGGNKQSTKISSLQYGDGSYIRLRNITLGYELPASLLQKFKIFNVKIYISGDNLWTGTRFPGMNPETIIATNGSDLGDTNSGEYPISKKIIFGISFGL